MPKRKSAKRKIRLGKRAAELLELPQEIDLSTPRMTMVGRSDLLLENLKEVLAVGETKICIETALGVISIEGESLIMGEFSGERAFIRGKIVSWCFEDTF